MIEISLLEERLTESGAIVSCRSLARHAATYGIYIIVVRKSKVDPAIKANPNNCRLKADLIVVAIFVNALWPIVAPGTTHR